MCAALGLGATNHHLIVLMAPALIGYFFPDDWRPVLRPRRVVAALLIVLLSLSLYLYLPIRARQDPPVNFGRPTTLAKTIDHIRRQPYKTTSEAARTSGNIADMLAHTVSALRALADGFTWPLVVVGLIGAASLTRRNRGFMAVTLAIVVLNIPVLNVLMRAPPNLTWNHVHRVYYFPAQAVFAIWISAGIALVLSLISARHRRWQPVGIGVAIALVASVFALNFRHADRSSDDLARRFGLAYLRSVPTDGGMYNINESIAFPCVYLKYVEGIRPDVAILSPLFGWDGDDVPIIISPVPLTDRLRQDQETLEHCFSYPYRIGYVFARSRTGPGGYGGFVGLETEAPDPLPLEDDADLWARSLHSLLSVYQARLGARHLVEDDTDVAAERFDKAEALACDAHSLHVLATIYGHLDIRQDRREPMLRRALALYDRHSDTYMMRYYPIVRDDIVTMLNTLAPP